MVIFHSYVKLPEGNDVYGRGPYNEVWDLFEILNM